MSNQKKLNKFKVVVAIFIIVLFVLNITGFARFVYNSIRDRYLASKAFYFSSDLLTTSTKDYTYSNWDGYGVYEIKFKLYSKNNDLQTFSEDLNYNLKVDFPEELNCQIGTGVTEDIVAAWAVDPEPESGEPLIVNQTATGTIENLSNEEEITIFVKARGEELSKGNTYNITVTAYTKDPYRKTITATFKLKISDVAYEIQDEKYRNYLMLNVRNIEDNTSRITIQINHTDKIRIDMNEEVVRDAKKIVTVSEEDLTVKKITFEIPKESSKTIKFYKIADEKNYSSEIDVFKITRSE